MKKFKKKRKLKETKTTLNIAVNMVEGIQQRVYKTSVESNTQICKFCVYVCVYVYVYMLL